MKVLLDRGAEVNAKETLRGTTALMWAADEGHAAAVQLLIERGADIKARSNPAPRGRGPALGKANDPRKAVAAQGAALAAREKSPDLNALQALQVSGATAAGTPARPAAPAATVPDAEQADEPRVRKAPDDGGALTPLVYAVRANDLESVKVLLAAGADVNQVTGYGWSPLLVATQNRYYKLGAFLLDQGADPNLANKGGWTPSVSGHRQPQHRERRLSGPQRRHGPPGVHQAAPRQGRRRQCPDEGQHRDPDGVHQPVARRARRHRVPAGIAVGRSRADEAAAGPRRRSEDRDDAGRDGAARRRRHRLGRRASPTNGRRRTRSRR